MATNKEEQEFNEQFLKRTRMLREKCNLEPEQIAKLLGVKLETYKKYETRTPLPRHLIPRFAKLVGTTIAYLMTGGKDF